MSTITSSERSEDDGESEGRVVSNDDVGNDDDDNYTLNTKIVLLFDAVLKLAQRRDSDNTTPDRAIV